MKVKKRSPLLVSRSFKLTVLVLFFVGLCIYSLNWLKRQDIFNVKEIIITPGQDLGLGNIIADLKGRNIFELDLLSTAERIKAIPAVKEATVVRALPDTLLLEVALRHPVAQVDLGQYYLVDREGVLLTRGRFLPFKDFIIIRGLSRDRDRQSRDLQLSISLIEAIEEGSTLKKADVAMVRINGDQNSISIFIKGGTEIILPIPDFIGKLAIFNHILASQGGLDKLSYIDLRFKEPVIKPR
jgi:cell division septal protein FtsQ